MTEQRKQASAERQRRDANRQARNRRAAHQKGRQSGTK